MKCHDRHFLFRVLAFVVHDQTDVFEETLKVLKILKRFHKFFEVFEPTRRLWRFVVLPKPRVAAFIKDHLGQFDMGICFGAHLRVPTVQTIDKNTKLFQSLPAQELPLNTKPRALNKRHAIGPRGALDGLHCFVAEAALGRIHDPLKRQIIVLRHRQPEIGHGIADLHPFVESWAADHTIGQPNRQKPILKRPHLVRRAHKDRHIIERMRLQSPRAPLQRLDLFPDPACFFLTIPMAD